MITQPFANKGHYRRLIVLLFLTLWCVSAAAKYTPAPDLVRQMRESYYRLHPPVSAHDQQIRQALDDLYFFSPGVFVWFGHSESLKLIEQALLNLEQAGQNGLRPDDYGSAALRRAWNHLLCRRHEDLADYARFDFSLSLALLHFLSDVRFGRIAPAAIRFDLESRRNLDSLVTLILSAITQNHVDKLAERAEPSHPPYRQLKRALNHYRKLENRSLPSLAFAHSIKPGERLRQIVDLQQTLKILGFMPEEESFSPSPDNHADSGTATGTVAALELQPTTDEHLYAGAVVEAVRQFQRQHGLAADGVIGRQTLAALNTPIQQRIMQLELAMEHWRWLPDLNAGRSLILVNIPAFHLWVYPDSDLSQPATLDMKVIVGMAADNQTPVFTGRLQYLEFGPYWNIPWKIGVKEILPKMLKDPEYLGKHNMELVADFHTDTQVLPLTESFADDLVRGRIHIRQRPGPDNALGKIKFIFPNHHAVYLHDTPSRRLFYKPRRDLSHGCVRVEQPGQLAEYILASANDWRKQDVLDALRKRQNRRVRLKQGFQVLLFYNTADVIDGRIYFYPDIYRLDQQLAERLQQHGYAVQMFKRQITAFLSPVADIPGIEVDKTARIIADAAAP